MTGESVEVAFVDQGYTGEQAASDAQAAGMRKESIMDCLNLFKTNLTD